MAPAEFPSDGAGRPVRADRPAVLQLNAAGADTAARAAAALGGEFIPLTPGRAAEEIRGLFAGGRTVIGVCAAGVLVRAVAPLLGDKRTEPPVLAVSVDGASIVPLLGGHRGANALARRLAAALEGRAAITTASDVVHGVALDAPPPGWRLQNPDQAKAAMAALAGGAPAHIAATGPCFLDPLVESGRARKSEDGLGAIEPLGREAEDTPARPQAAERQMTLSVGGATLRYRAQQVAIGVGCARGCAAEELDGLIDVALDRAGRAPAEVAGLFSIDVKADEAAVSAAAERLEAPARFFSAAELEAIADQVPNPSEVVRAEVGTRSVAEAAALLGAGPGAELTVEKRKSANATVALACAPDPIITLSGRPRGRLAVVGIGPGRADWRTPEASRLIAEAEELVGYGLYLDLLGPLVTGTRRVEFPLGGEEDRCRHALERAGEGRSVALVCSGDAGIYAMGALVMELLARGDDPGGVSAAARRVEVVMSPGVSALQAASARAGALIGHDFCAISLSDLLTPRETILRRLQAAADGDFVAALYNPVSRRRRTLLAAARDIFAARRPAETPVLLAQNLGRPEERLARRRLESLDVDEVDMLTVVLIGSSESRCFETGDGRWRMFTPRGYAAKGRPGGEAGEKGRETGGETRSTEKEARP